MGIYFMDFFIPIAQAQPPPDFLYQVGSQAFQFSSMIIVGIGFVFGWTHTLYSKWKKISSFRRSIFVSVLLLVLSTVSAIFYFSPAHWISQPASILPVNVFQSAAMPIDNAELAQLFQNSPSLLLIDVREDEERSAGFIPGSSHVRMADVYAGAWRDFPQDQPVYVHCNTGARSSSVAKFLREQGVESFYLSDRLEDWKSYHHPWQGILPFSDQHSRGLRVQLETEQAQKVWQNGALLVDARSVERQSLHPIPQSISLPILDLSSEELMTRFDDIPKHVPVLIVTDNIHWGAFSAFLAAVKLVERGYEVSGIISTQDFLKLVGSSALQ